MSRRRILVLDGPHAGKWVPDYGNIARLLDTWSPASALHLMFGIPGIPDEIPERLYYKRKYVARPDGVVYVREGYSLWPLDSHVPHLAIVSITAEALLSS
jgi:hypothetical protein